MSTRVNDLENQRDSSDLEGSWFIVDGDEAKKGDCHRASGISDSQAKDKDALLERIIWLGPKALRRAVDDSRAWRGSKRTSQDGGPANSSRQIDSHGKSAGIEVQDNTSKQGPRVDSQDTGKRADGQNNSYGKGPSVDSRVDNGLLGQIRTGIKWPAPRKSKVGRAQPARRRSSKNKGRGSQVKVEGSEKS